MSFKNMEIEICIENFPLYMIIILGVLYFFKSIIFKKCVLCMFKNSGNICILEKKIILDAKTHELKEETKEVLNVARSDIKENATIYVTNPKFYELLFLRGEEGLGEAFVKEYFETDELDDLLQIVYTVLNRKIHKAWLKFYSNLEECFYKQFKMTRETFSLNKDVLENFKDGFLPFSDFNVKDGWEGTLVLQNGLYSFENTFIQKLYPDKKMLDYREMERIVDVNHLKIETLERKSSKYEWKLDKELIIKMSSKEEYNTFYYYTCVLKFLLKNNFISFNYLFCKK